MHKGVGDAMGIYRYRNHHNDPLKHPTKLISSIRYGIANYPAPVCNSSRNPRDPGASTAFPRDVIFHSHSLNFQPGARGTDRDLQAPAAPPFLATPTCQSVLGLAGAFWAPDTPTSSVRSTAMATATPGAAAAAAPDVGTLFLSKREARLSRTGPVPAPGRGSQHDALPWGHPRRDYALEFGGPSRTRHSTTTKRGGRAEENGDGVPHCVPMPALRPKRVRCSEDRGFDA